MFDCLNSIKVPSRYSLDIQGRINMKEKKFTNLKSHDCHVLMTQFLLVALRVIPTQYVPFREIHGSSKEVCSQSFSARRMYR
jgi:hypothetical protein